MQDHDAGAILHRIAHVAGDDEGECEDVVHNQLVAILHPGLIEHADQREEIVGGLHKIQQAQAPGNVFKWQVLNGGIPEPLLSLQGPAGECQHGGIGDHLGSAHDKFQVFGL